MERTLHTTDKRRAGEINCDDEPNLKIAKYDANSTVNTVNESASYKNYLDQFDYDEAEGDNPWSCLPEHILVDIFLHLPLKQRFWASVTCKDWYGCFHNPELWIRFTFFFYMPKQISSLECVAKHGRHLRYVDIELDQTVPLNRDNACKVIKGLAELKESRLRSIRIRFMGENPYFYAGLEFVDALTQLFSSSMFSLRDVDLSGLNVMYDDPLFELLSTNHPFLEKLNIQNRMLVCKVNPPCILGVVMRCRKLKQLYIYNFSMCEAVLLALTEPDREPLEHLALQCRREEKYGKTVNGSTWAAVKEKLPHLRVTLGFDHTCPMQKVSEMMQPEIPVSVLRLETFTYIYDEVRQANRYYNQTLTKLILQTPMSRNSPELNKALLELAETCKKLSALHVFCVLYKETVEEILALHPYMEKRKTYTLRYTADTHPWTSGRDC